MLLFLAYTKIWGHYCRMIRAKHTVVCWQKGCCEIANTSLGGSISAGIQGKDERYRSARFAAMLASLLEPEAEDEPIG
jgi:hypothetical protein